MVNTAPNTYFLLKKFMIISYLIMQEVTSKEISYGKGSLDIEEARSSNETISRSPKEISAKEVSNKKLSFALF